MNDAQGKSKLTGSMRALLVLLVLAASAFIQSTVASRTVVDAPLGFDAGEYFSYAYNLKNFGVYSVRQTWVEPPPVKVPAPDKLRSPGYPLFLLAVGKPQPYAEYGLRVSFVQAGLGVASVLLIYLIAAQFLPFGMALAAAALTAIEPSLATINTYLLTESLFTFLLLAATWSLIRALASRRTWIFAASGVLWAAAGLVRPTAQFFPLLGLALVVLLPSLAAYRKQVLVGFACFLALSAPWALRNLSIPDNGPSLMVNTLAHGSYPGFMYQGRPETFAYPYHYDPELPKFTKDLPSVLGHIADNFRAEPLVQARWYLLGKPYFFLSLRDAQSNGVFLYAVSASPYNSSALFRALRSVSDRVHWPLMLLALAGLFIVVVRPGGAGLDASPRQAATVVALLVAYAIGFHMVAAPFPRYAIPFRPALFALAMFALYRGWLALGDRSK